jgi:UDP-N-acetyl-D-galactosamine dehydrogenase
VSGDDAGTLEKVARAVRLGGHGRRLPRRSIKVAEAAKVIENTQRDLNIALRQRAAIIFEQHGHRHARGAAGGRHQVELPAVPPGLVGGHCIGVDPYYLTHKAELLGYHPQVILAGRRINDSMGPHIARKAISR